MPTVKPPKSKKVNVEKNQIDFISGADRDPQEWDQYDNEEEKSTNFRLTQRKNEMLKAGAKKMGKELGIHVSKQGYIMMAIRNQLKKDLGVDPNDLD